MRRNIVAVLALSFALGGTALAQNEKPVRSISVSGTVETETAPDLIIWRISLSDADKDMRAAKEMNDRKVKAVVALREKLGIGAGDLETGRLSIRKEYDRDDRGRRGDFKEFVANRTVTIRQRDLKKFDEFLDALVASTEMEVSFSFESSKMHKIRADTRLKALKEAKKKAAAMADVVGAKLGPAITISEHAQETGWRTMTNSQNYIVQSSPSVDLATDTFVPGAITVRATVYATFELE